MHNYISIMNFCLIQIYRPEKNRHQNCDEQSLWCKQLYSLLQNVELRTCRNKKESV